MSYLQAFVQSMARSRGRQAWVTATNEIYVISTTGWPERVNLATRNPLPDQASSPLRRHILEPVHVALWIALRS